MGAKDFVPRDTTEILIPPLHRTDLTRFWKMLPNVVKRRRHENNVYGLFTNFVDGFGPESRSLNVFKIIWRPSHSAVRLIGNALKSIINANAVLRSYYGRVTIWCCGALTDRTFANLAVRL